MTTILSILCVVLLVIWLVTLAALVAALVFVVRYGNMILRWEAVIDDSLDVLDDVYAKIDKIANMNLFVNTPEVRHAMSEIERARDVVLYVANAMVLPAEKTLHETRMPTERKSELERELERLRLR